MVLLWADLLGGGKDPEHLDSERRLLYVGLTRAEDILAVLWSGANSALVARLEALAPGAVAPTSDGREAASVGAR